MVFSYLLRWYFLLVSPVMVFCVLDHISLDILDIALTTSLLMVFSFFFSWDGLLFQHLLRWSACIGWSSLLLWNSLPISYGMISLSSLVTQWRASRPQNSRHTTTWVPEASTHAFHSIIPQNPRSTVDTDS